MRNLENKSNLIPYKNRPSRLLITAPIKNKST
jgi:hypothetical protein